MAFGYNKTSQKRLTMEYRKLNDLPPGVTVSLPDDSDVYTWEASLEGPKDSLYQGGTFTIRILATVEYPMKPPDVHFVDPFPYHLNVNQTTGQVCLGLLGDGWDPSFTIGQILHALVALLIRPEVGASMDHETLNKYTHFKGFYDRAAKRSASNATRKK